MILFEVVGIIIAATALVVIILGELRARKARQ